MRCELLFFPICFSLVACFASTLNAQVPEDLQRLKKENSVLKSELAKKSKLLNKAVAAGFVFDEKPFQSALEIISTLPKDLALKTSKPWDQVQTDEAIKHLKRASIGKYFKTKLTIESVRLQENRDHVKDRAKPKFVVDVKFRRRAFPKSGLVVWQAILPLGGSLTFYGDDEFAKRVKKLRRGKKYLIEGLIRDLEFRYNSVNGVSGKTNQHTLRLTLSRILFPALE